MLHSTKGRHSKIMTLPVRYPGATLWTIGLLSVLCCLLGSQLLLTQRRCPPSGSARPLQASDDHGYLTVYVPAHGSRPLSQLLSFRDDTLSPILAQVRSEDFLSGMLCMVDVKSAATPFAPSAPPWGYVSSVQVRFS